MVNNITERAKCTGCGACAATCPCQCIAMKLDESGFPRPAVDEQVCLDCKRCVRICPINADMTKPDGMPVCLGMYNKDLAQRKLSSSGGVFILLAELIIQMGGYVFGAVMTGDCLGVHHIGTNSMADVQNMMRSKYVQSETVGAYRFAKELLDKDNPVLFSGTPCQIAGLKRYLQKEYPKLYTQDIVCHGVPSAGLWAKYAGEKVKRAGANMQHVSFRDKTKGWKSYSVSYCFTNGKQQKAYGSDDLYMRAMISNLSLRESCFECQFKGAFTQSDITLGDFWEIDNVAPEMNDGMGCSLILIQTYKGQWLIEQIRDKCCQFEVPAEQLHLEGSMRYHSVPFNLRREQFLKDAMTRSTIETLACYCGEGVVSKMKKTAWRLLREMGVK